MSKCYKDKAKRLLVDFNETKPKPTGDGEKDARKLSAFSYIKRSLELMAKGLGGAIEFDDAGKVLAAASYKKEGKFIRLETMGSYGGYDAETRTTAGMRALASVYENASETKGVRIYAENPDAADWYTRFEATPSKGDFRDMTATPSDYIPFVAFVKDALAEKAKKAKK